MFDINKIDKLIAEKVMGWTHCNYGFWETEFGELDVESEWNPSVDIGDAWKVAEKVSETTGRLMLTKVHDGFACELEWNGNYGFHKSAPMAICSAALQSLGVDIDD